MEYIVCPICKLKCKEKRGFHIHLAKSTCGKHTQMVETYLKIGKQSFKYAR